VDLGRVTPNLDSRVFQRHPVVQAGLACNVNHAQITAKNSIRRWGGDNGLNPMANEFSQTCEDAVGSLAGADPVGVARVFMW